MAKKKKQASLSTWAFWIGVVVAAIVGISDASGTSLGTFTQYIPVLLVVLGLVVGFANITAKETTPFLLASVALLIFVSTGLLVTLDELIPQLGTLLGTAVQQFALFIGAAALVVAFKEAWELAAN